MLWHDFRLASQSIRRSPFISALVVLVIAVGIGTSVIAITLYHAKAGNPIWWKNDVLFRPLLDSRPWGQDMEVGRTGHDPPYVMIYRDALALYQSTIPDRSVMMLVSVGSVQPVKSGERPIERTVRLTTREFFPIFDVPFLYGHGWSKTDDDSPSQVVVITRYLSERLFGSGNSVGRSLNFNGQQLTVIGVIDHWLPVPRFYDVGNDFGPANDLFVPFKWAASLPDLQFPGYCQQARKEVRTFKEIASGDCIAIALWTELASGRQHEDYWRFMDNYAHAQIQAGRFVRPVNNRLANVATWLEMNDVVGNESKLLVILALVFLGICVLNTIGLLLAKFLSAAPIAGLRRALGATRGDITRQHLLEVVVLSIAGGAFGIGIAALSLRLIRVFLFWQSGRKSDNPDFGRIAQSLSHMDWKMVLLAAGLSFLAGILSGIYPAWRVGRVAPATFLRVQ